MYVALLLRGFLSSGGTHIYFWTTRIYPSDTCVHNTPFCFVVSAESFYSVLFEIAPPVESLFTRSKRVQGEVRRHGVSSTPPPLYTVCSLGYCGLSCVILSSTVYSSKYIYRTDNTQYDIMVRLYMRTGDRRVVPETGPLPFTLFISWAGGGGVDTPCQNSTLCRSRCCESMHMPMMVRVATPPYPLP